MRSSLELNDRPAGSHLHSAGESMAIQGTAIVKSGTQEQAPVPAAHKPDSVPRDSKSATARARTMRPMATSVSLPQDELDHARKAAYRRNMTFSAYVRDVLRKAMSGETNVAAPKTIGITDNVYAPTIRDDVVVLANQLTQLAFAVAMLERRLTRRRRVHTRALIAQAVEQLQRISGVPRC
jgi:hypothetical protein